VNTTIAMRLQLAAVLALIVLFAAGCGSSSEPGPDEVYAPAPDQKTAAPKGTFKPYTLRGKTYYPLARADGFVEEGYASWYGRDFHGKPTANGETYNMYAMTAAHKILPMGTKLNVFNLENGRSIFVRINDRGPFVADRIIDLSYAAADKLGMADQGLAKVRIKSIGNVPGTTPEGDLKGEFYVQIGSFMVRDNARALARVMANRGHTVRLQEALVRGERFWRVQVGIYDKLSHAHQAREKFEGSYPGAFIVAR
jgi:rare lipoprotein A